MLRPPHRATPKAIVHFVGGAFVGAAPQLTYRLLLELLASKGLMVRLVWLWADRVSIHVLCLHSSDPMALNAVLSFGILFS